MSRGDGRVVSSAAADLVELQEEVDRVRRTPITRRALELALIPH